MPLKQWQHVKQLPSTFSRALMILFDTHFSSLFHHNTSSPKESSFIFLDIQETVREHLLSCLIFLKNVDGKGTIYDYCTLLHEKAEILFSVWNRICKHERDT